MVKLTIPARPGRYAGLAADPRVLRVLALSGGYRRDEACALLATDPSMIASFSPVPVTAGPWPGIPVRGRNAHGRAQACWLPVLPGATPHSCRHGRETCMNNHGVPKVLRDLVMGHRTAGMEGVYAHVTLESRAALIAADEPDWNSSLAARAAISAHSPVRVLDTLLAPFWSSQP